jgi:type VI secretion system protein VasD
MNRGITASALPGTDIPAGSGRPADLGPEPEQPTRNTVARRRVPERAGGTNRRVLLACAGLLALARCGSPPPPPVLQLSINGGADQNPDGAGRAAPVAVRVYQLSGTAKFTQSDVFALKDNEAKTLGGEAAAGSQEYLISPGEKKSVTIDLKPMVSSIGVAVLYRDIDHANWRATAPANAHGPTNLTATVGKLALTLR